MIKLVIDSVIPFIKGVFEPYAEVLYKEGSCITHDDILDADGLVIRTRTACDAEMLKGTGVKMIATATIGTDHIDMDYCNANSIHVQNAAGCNAGGVMGYVFSALYGCAARKSIDLTGATLGIVGVGMVGHKVENMARALGFKVLLNDPPRQLAEGGTQFCELDYLLENSDVVTMHVPLCSSTRGMVNEDFLAKIKLGAIFINAARGEIVDDDALLSAIPKLGAVVLDTWNGEPYVNKTLLDRVDIATPHIAGYTYQGKQNGTSSAVRAMARFFGFKELYDFFPAAEFPGLDAVRVDVHGMNQGQVASIFQYNYPIFTDDFLFRVDPDGFERLRSEYKYRREYYID